MGKVLEMCTTTYLLSTRTKSQNDKSPCNMRLGATEFPALMQKYAAFAAGIKQ